MIANRWWEQDHTRAQIYRAVQAAGDAGISRSALREQIARAASVVDLGLKRMLEEGHLARTPWDWYRVGERIPPIRGTTAEMALSVLDDCPSGISLELLADELMAETSDALRALQQLEAQGRAERIAIPPEHGGTGWRLCPAAPDPHAAESAPAEVLEVPVFVELDIDRIHHLRGAVAPAPHAAAADDADAGDSEVLTVAVGSLALTLPRDDAYRLAMRIIDALEGKAQTRAWQAS